MDVGYTEQPRRGAYVFAGDDAGGIGRPSALTVSLFIGAIVAVVLVIYLIIQVWDSNASRDVALRRERHTYDVMLVTRSAETAMARSEAALGRFVASGDPELGTEYYNKWLLAGVQIDQLARLVRRDTEEAEMIAHLRKLYDERGKELGSVATRAYYRQGWPALVVYTSVGHSPLIGRMDRVLESISDRERGKLEARYDTSDATASAANWLAQLLSATGLILILAAATLAWLAWSAIETQRSTRAQADAADNRAAELEHAVAERTRALSDANDRLHDEMRERAAAEAQLRQIQKMEAVGQLTGGIAHDFNNMLAVVVGGLELAKRRLESETAEVGRHIDNAMEGANRAAALTRRLLGFARAETLLPEAIDPSQLIAAMSDMIDRTLGERVTVQTRIAPHAWRIWIDPLQLENAILNLAVNARDAMEGAGTLTISLDNVVLGPGEIGGLEAGDHVRICVADNGCGMSPEVLEHVFEPFFTTKPVGKGTGLGLSQIFGLVRQSAGEITIESAVGEGTTVALYLPRERATAQPSRQAIPADVPALTLVKPPQAVSGETVLVVEDDPRVRISTVALLEEMGYLPIACAGGEEALIALEQRANIRLMITDVVMPGMTGPELATVVRRIRPHLGILFVTGYAGEAGDSGELSGELVLRKPFTMGKLEQAVSDAFARLNAPHPARGAEAAE